MQQALLLLTALLISQPEALGPGDHKRTITVDHAKRVHWIHVPPKYDPKQPTPVVLALHGASMVDKLMEGMTGLDKTADEHNFIVVYPNGTGFIQTWNAGLFPGTLTKTPVDDVKYLNKVLDDVSAVVNVDQKRVYATGLSNGGMMCYRLASEMSDRIAAIAPVAGTMAVEKYQPKRPVPVLHFHGTKDPLVPFSGPEKNKDGSAFLKFRSVEDTILACVKANGCSETPIESEPLVKDEKLKVVRKEYPKGKAAVILYVIEEGGHVWPGVPAPAFLGESTRQFAANELIWQFFSRQSLK
jgi:polyhydroxybutyrate depolymerase